MDALIKSLRPAKPSDAKISEAKIPESRPAELDPSEFLAAAVRADQPRPSRAEAEQAVNDIFSGRFGAGECVVEEFLEGEEASNGQRRVGFFVCVFQVSTTSLGRAA